jgi:ABC-type uncharacterized transport system involved in gliding motility auxiliary subunit
MGSLAEEKNKKTLETIITAPVGSQALILGKFFGVFSVYLLMLLVTTTIPASLSIFGKFDFGLVATSYLGLILLGSLFISIGIFISSVTESQIVAFVLSLVIAMSFVLLGSDAFTYGLSPFFASLLSSFGIFPRISAFNKGVVDLRDIIYFVSFSLSFLLLSFVVLAKDRVSKTKKFLSLTLKTSAGIVLCATLFLNIVTKPIFLRLDLTRDKVYTLSRTSKELLQKLDGATVLSFYYSKDLPPEFSERKSAILDLLNDLSKVPGGKLKVEYKEVNTPEDENSAIEKGVTPVQFNTVKNDEFQAKKGFLGIAVIAGEKKEAVAFLESSEGLEYQIISLVKRVSGGSSKKVSFLQDAKSLGLYSDLSVFRDELSKYYLATSLSLAKDPKDKTDKTIPNDTDIVVIAGPKDNIDENTKTQIKKFVDSGKSLIVFSDSYDVSIATLSPTINSTNINEILSPYGVSINKNIVYDLKYNERINLNQGFFTYVLPYPYFARFPITDSGKSLIGSTPGVLTAWGSDLQIKNVEGISYTQLAKSSGTSGASETEPINVSPNTNFESQGLKDRVVAVLAETSNGGKVIVVSNDDIIAKDFIGANTVFALNLFDVASNDKGFVAIRSKSSIPSPLIFRNDQEKAVVKYGNLIGVPLLIAMFGLIRLKLRSVSFSRKY